MASSEDNSSIGAPEIIFQGIDGTECEDFIAAVEKLAFTEGWSRDRERKLLLARSGLRAKALRWFAKLDQSKKEDWDSFVDALLDQYPPNEELQEASTPVWSTTTYSPSGSTVVLRSDAASDFVPKKEQERKMTGQTMMSESTAFSKARPYSSALSGRQLGTLRIIVEDGAPAPQYISQGRAEEDMIWKHGDPVKTTVNRLEALVVCFVPRSRPHHIGCINFQSQLSYLCIDYRPYDNDMNRVALHSGGLSSIPENGSYTGFVSDVWCVLPDGTLEASLCALDKSVTDSKGNFKRQNFKSSEVHLNVQGASINFVKPGTPLWGDDPTLRSTVGGCEIKARIVFEPI